MRQCIERCLECYWTCRHQSTTHCLETGGDHVKPDHFKLMMSCAEICRTAADIMLIGSPHHEAVCTACAEICEACAKSCEELHDMEKCAHACRDCAESCRKIGGAPVHAAMRGEYYEQPDS
jgi:hypothetical protein